MDWGNAILTSKKTDPSSGRIVSIEMTLHLEGDFKKTKKKITWLSKPTDQQPLVPVTLLDYDYLITKKKLEEGDNVEDFITPVTEFTQHALADVNVKDLKKGDSMQFERRAYYIFDGEGADGRMEFIKIPDGKAANLASKAGPPAAATVTATTVQDSAPASNMYKVESVFGDHSPTAPDTKMYKVESVFKP